MGNKIMMIVIIVLLVVLIGLVGFVTFYGLQVLQNAGEPANNQPAAMVERVLSQQEMELVKYSNPIRANLKQGESGRNHAVSLTVSIGVDNTDKRESPEIITLLSDREPVVRDIIGALLRETTYEELLETNDFHGIEILRQNILTALRVEFASNLIAMVVMDILYQ